MLCFGFANLQPARAWSSTVIPAPFFNQAVSGRVDKAFREHAPEFEILADNEHIWMVHRDIVNPPTEGAAPTATAADGKQAGSQENSDGPTAQRQRSRRLL